MVARTSRLAINTLGLPIATGRLLLISFRYNRGLSISDFPLRPPRIGTHFVCGCVSSRSKNASARKSVLAITIIRHNARVPAKAESQGRRTDTLVFRSVHVGRYSSR